MHEEPTPFHECYYGGSTSGLRLEVWTGINEASLPTVPNTTLTIHECLLPVELHWPTSTNAYYR